MKKVIAVFLSVLMLASCFSVAAFADDEVTTGTFSVFTYNVAGLPDFSAVTGEAERTPEANQTVIGKYVNDNGYDIFATQEDFGYHDTLVAQLKSYNYATLHHGSIPYGDGTNVFTKTMKLYNEDHTPWRSLYGILDDGADQFSQKGITYVAIEIADGIIIDFYDIHADAYDDEGSRAARADNFVQLAEMINSRDVDRPVIVTGDFNEYLLSSNSTIKTTLCDGCGLKDAWIELYNDGNYESDAPYIASLNGESAGDKWGRWDSVERFLYKDGGGITLTCDSSEYINVYDADGNNCSDHAAVTGVFTYTKAADSSADEGTLSEKKTDSWAERLRRFVMFFKAIWLAIKNFDVMKAYLTK